MHVGRDRVRFALCASRVSPTDSIWAAAGPARAHAVRPRRTVPLDQAMAPRDPGPAPFPLTASPARRTRLTSATAEGRRRVRGPDGAVSAEPAEVADLIGVDGPRGFPRPRLVQHRVGH